jgi:hypothetical protein
VAYAGGLERFFSNSRYHRVHVLKMLSVNKSPRFTCSLSFRVRGLQVTGMDGCGLSCGGNLDTVLIRSESADRQKGHRPIEFLYGEASVRRRHFWLTLTVLSLLFVFAQDSVAGKPASIHFKGRFLGFFEVDSRWAVFCVQGDSTFTAGVSAADVDLFVAAMGGAVLDIEAEVVDTYEENGVQKPIYGMIGASLNGYTAKEWASDTQKALGYQRADKLFNALADSMVMDQEPPRCKY